eukprot:scaffold51084_cov18-Tisochrysis_lutea.AAC.1
MALCSAHEKGSREAPPFGPMCVPFTTTGTSARDRCDGVCVCSMDYPPCFKVCFSTPRLPPGPKGDFS